MLRLERHRLAIAEVLLHVGARAEQPLLFAAPQAEAHRTAQLEADAFRIRIASSMIAEPTRVVGRARALCHESKWAPSMTTSSALSVPGSSATTLKPG